MAGVAAEEVERARAAIACGPPTAAARGSPSCIGRPSLAEPSTGAAEAALLLAASRVCRSCPRCGARTSTGPSTSGWPPACCRAATGLDDGRAWYEHHWGAPLPEGRAASTRSACSPGRRRERSTSCSFSERTRFRTAPTRTWLHSRPRSAPASSSRSTPSRRRAPPRRRRAPGRHLHRTARKFHQHRGPHHLARAKGDGPRQLPGRTG